MTPEEMQRAIEFIIQHQAQFAANIDRLDADRQKDLPRLARVEAAFVTLTEIADIQSRRLDSHDREFQTLLRESQQRHDEAITYLRQILDRLV